MGTEAESDPVKIGAFVAVKVDENEVEYEKYLNTPPRPLRQFRSVPKPTGGSTPPHSTSKMIAKLM